MFVPLERLTRRRRGPGRKRGELAALRRRVRRAVTRERASLAEIEAAREVGRLRDELIASLGSAAACGECARGMSSPAGEYPGGLCCSGATEDVFRDEEIDLLVLLGARPRDFAPPRGDEQAGCLFRGPTSCSLPAERRPTICTYYVCRELMGELAGRGGAASVSAVQEALFAAMKRYIRIREERVAAAEFCEAFSVGRL